MPTTDIPIEAIYRTGAILEALTNLPPAGAFLRDTLFNRIFTTEADLIDVNYYNGRAKLAPYCSRFSKGTAIPREKTKLSLFEPPFMRPTRFLTADQLLNRRTGNASTTDAELLASDTMELDNMITRSEESMVANCLFTGKIKCLDGDTNEIVAELDYGPISRTVVSTPWSDTTNGDPLKDLKTAMRLVASASGFSADTVVMGRDAADAFENSPKVLNAFDKKFVEPGVISPKLLTWGVTVLGQWRGIPLYADEQTYEDATGAQVPFCDPKCVLIAAIGSQNTMAYAGVPQAEDDRRELTIPPIGKPWSPN
jgi:Phage major capsid protein E